MAVTVKNELPKNLPELSIAEKNDRIYTLLKHDLVKKIASLIVGGFLGAFAITFFVEKAQLLSSGVTGISLSLSRVSPISFDVYTLLFNFPLFIFGMFFVGKKFSILSMAFAGIIVLWRIPLTNIDLNILSDPTGNDRLLAVVFGSLTYGFAVSILFKNGVSTGGVDYIAVFVSQRKQIQTGKLLMFFLFGTLMTASAIETLSKPDASIIDMFNETLGYTLIGIFIEGKVIDTIYPKYKKFRVTLTTTEKTVDAIMKAAWEAGYERTFTLQDSVGGYTKQKRKTMITICSYYEVTFLIDRIKTIDPEVFATITRVEKVEGKFSIK